MPKYQTQIRMIRQYGRILRLHRNRLTYRVFKWDHGLNTNGVINSWTNEIKSILYENNMSELFDAGQRFSVQAIIPQLKLSMAENQQNGN